MSSFVVPAEPVRTALIGAGVRSRTVYAPMAEALAAWVKIVAVCDPVADHADALADRLGVRAFYDIHGLVKARPMEAALIVTPIPSLHSISVFLSSHGIHNLAETTWCSLLAQARQMIQVADRNRVIVRVGENFFRFPADRIVQAIKRTGFVGEILRVISYNDHTGYHNNSRWIVLAGTPDGARPGHQPARYPTSVQSLTHTMPTASFHSSPERFHRAETYRAHFITFPGNRLVIDHASNVKGFLGRHARPGYTEWQGTRGTIVYAAPPGKAWNGEGEVRYCSDTALASGAGVHDKHFPIVDEYQDGRWKRIFVDLPVGHLEYANPFFHLKPTPQFESRPWYQIPVAEHVGDFALAVRGLRPSEFDEQDAMMSLMTEVAAHESELNDGARITLPLDGEPAAERAAVANLRKQYGVDPMDVEAMLAISYPKS